ncbi:MAG TPA: tRNA lysidine(34) synthetase TilS [Pirellulales bacterium]|nr:tRNA lysidine(34) synthetase TilS [Pirellulales bacterium]
MARHFFEQRLADSWPPAHWHDLTVVVAVSGGADSVALLRGLAAVRLAGRGRLIAAHFNHLLRAGRAEADERFVVELSGSLGLPCEVGHAPVAEMAGAAGDGLEAAARNARYEFLQAAAERLGARYVVTAHTADDQAETVLHRVLRGTALAGLSGMPRARPLGPAATLLRPMLALRRADVTAYLAELGQPYCNDATNADPAYTRNRLRRDLLPQLAEQYNPQVIESLCRLGQLAGQAQTAISAEVEGLLPRCVRSPSQGRLLVDCRILSGQARYLVRELLVAAWRGQGWGEQAMGFEQWEQLAELVLTCSRPGVDDPSAIMLPGAIRAARKGFDLSLEKTPDST